MRTIKAKFTIGFILIFGSLLLLLNVVVGIFLRNNNDSVIQSEMESFMNHSNVFVRQTFLVNGKNNEQEAFAALAPEIVQDLCDVTGGSVAAYDNDGMLIQASSTAAFEGADYEDMKNALSDKLSFTIVQEGNKVRAYFAFPVMVAGEKVGILRFCKPYQDLYAQSTRTGNFILFASLIVFTVAFIFTYILSASISRPIVTLTRATNQVARGRRVTLRKVQRNDEIGRLIQNYNTMVRRIEQQIRIIEHDRDALQTLNAHRKDFYDQLTHELKTPLTTVLGYAEIIQQNGFTDKQFFDMGMQYIIDESNRLNGMVRSLLEFSKGISQVQEPHVPIDLSAIAQQTVSEMQLKAKRYLCECITQIEPDCYMLGAADEIKRVLLNLIDNAIKYGDRGGVIQVQVYRTKRRVCFSVANQGPPLTQEQLHKLFIPFYQTEQKPSQEVGSAGLGLAIVKNIVDEHNGQVRMESEDGITVAHVWFEALEQGKGGPYDDEQARA